MDFFSPATLAFIKIFISFGIILLAIQFRINLSLAIIAASLFIAFFSGLSLPLWGETLLSVTTDKQFLSLLFMVYFLLLLSGVQAASGQSKRLVLEIEKRVQSPKARLVIFPALIGLLPMPGGALFSCPMLDVAARNIPITAEKKALINYWFRHIWEIACPLYPGYILATSLLDLPLSTICKYNFPIVIVLFLVGCFFFLRNLPVANGSHKDTFLHEKKTRTVLSLLVEALPLVITIGGAFPVYLFSTVIIPSMPSKYAFSFSLILGIICAFYQGRRSLSRKTLFSLFINKSIGKMLFLIFAIYGFKNIISTSGILSSISSLNLSGYTLYSLFFLLPFISGNITGIMVGFVGSTFPILISIIEKMGLQAYTLPLMILAILGGNCGQMITPLHVCFAVTCDYYKVSVPNVWKKLVPPVSVVALISIIWAIILGYSGAKF